MTTNYLIKNSGTKNVIILKGDVGQQKPQTFDLPDFDFSFGKPNQLNPIGVDKIIKWSEHVTELGYKTSEFKPSSNLAILDEDSISRKQHVKLKSANLAKGVNIYNHKIPNQNQSFGIKNKPSTPIKNVVGMNIFKQQEFLYNKEGEMRCKNIYENRNQFNEVSIIYRNKSKVSQISRHLASQKPVEKIPFVLKQFSNIQQKVNSHNRNRSAQIIRNSQNVLQGNNIPLNY